MSTTILDSRELQELQPAHALWKQYVPKDAPYRFRAKDLIQAEQWQEGTRQALAEVIGFQSAPAVPLEPQVIEEEVQVGLGIVQIDRLALGLAPAVRLVSSHDAGQRFHFLG